MVNKRPIEEYFPLDFRRRLITLPMDITETAGQFDILVNAKGGGITGQAGATQLGIARALLKFNAEFRKSLRDAGMLTRDPRMVERKKYGQPKARKRFQFSKR
jgi:small subunit ribosomal protein S9